MSTWAFLLELGRVGVTCFSHARDFQVCFRLRPVQKEAQFFEESSLARFLVWAQSGRCGPASCLARFQFLLFFFCLVDPLPASFVSEQLYRLTVQEYPGGSRGRGGGWVLPGGWVLVCRTAGKFTKSTSCFWKFYKTCKPGTRPERSGGTILTNRSYQYGHFVPPQVDCI